MQICNVVHIYITTQYIFNFVVKFFFKKKRKFFENNFLKCTKNEF